MKKITFFIYRLHLTILFLLSLLFSLNSQDIQFDLKVIDLNTQPGFGNAPYAVQTIGDKTYIAFGSGRNNELMVYGQHNLTSLYKGTAGTENIRFYGVFKEGFFLSLGAPASGLALYYMDAQTDSIALIIEDNFRDINILKDQAIFSAWRGDIYSTDGTAADTQLVLDSDDHPFDTYGNSLLTAVNGKQLFVLDGSNESVWSTDGTPEGTQQLLEGEPNDLDINEAYPKYFESHQNKAYFILGPRVPIEKRGLWATDGTPMGTQKLTGLGTDFLLRDEGGLLSTKAGLLFAATNEDYGNEYWITDGTTEGTKLVKDVAPGSESAAQAGPSNYSHQIFEDLILFKYGNSIWQCDGTMEGTKEILNLTNFPKLKENWVIRNSFTNLNGQIFFNTNHQSGMNTLWTYQSEWETPRELITKEDPFFPRFNYPSDTKVFFTVGSQVWVTDGTKEGTLLLNTYTTTIDALTTYNDKFYFKNTFEHGDTLLVSDGTILGTGVLKTTLDDVEFVKPTSFFQANDQLYFFAREANLGLVLLTSNGAKENTKVIQDIYPFTQNSNIRELRTAIDRLFFIRNGSLWVSDGTLEGSSSLNVSATQWYLHGEVNGKMLFSPDRRNIWVTDGSVAGTKQLINNTSFYLFPFTQGFTLYKDQLWFFYDDGINGLELWQTDGTVNGTKMAFESASAEATIFRRSIFILDNETFLFFNNIADTTGHEIWISDGTLSGTTLLEDSNPGENIIGPGGQVIFKDKFLFSVNRNMWVTNGTSEGTLLLKEDLSYSPNDNPSIINGSFIFRANDQLWKTDGTPEGTQLVKDITPIRESITMFGDKVAFFTQENNQTQLWISDGTPEGTQPIKPLAGSNIAIVGTLPYQSKDYLFFIDTKEESFFKTIWYSDGTTAGTHSVPFDFEELRDPEDLTLAKGKLFFLGSTVFGRELSFFDFQILPSYTGVVFHDQNQNGIQEEGEEGIPNIPIIAENEDRITTYSDEQGNFEFFIEKANYQLFPISNSCWELTTPNKLEVDTTQSSEPLLFGFRAIFDYQHAQARLISAPTRCGFTVPFWLSIENEGCQSVNGYYGIVLHPLVSLVGTEKEPSEIRGDTLLWNYENLAPAAHESLGLTFEIAGAASIGEIIYLPAVSFIQNEQGELNVASIYDFNAEIRCAYDPNDKLLLPNRAMESTSQYDENYTLFNEIIEYTIRFQNTGNDTAFNVLIRDTLDQELDWSTFQPIQASHPYDVQLSKNGAVAFSFPNILLPDSTTNEPLSHGFLNYQIAPKNNLIENTIIENTASIYFDFNPPIVTNTTQSVMVSELPKTTALAIPLVEHKVDIYPNPFTGTLTINKNATLPTPVQVELLNSTGQIVKIIEVNERIQQIPTADLLSGFYYYQVVSENRDVIQFGKLVKQ